MVKNISEIARQSDNWVRLQAAWSFNQTSNFDGFSHGAQKPVAFFYQMVDRKQRLSR
jgi:hypothetical protein